MENFFFIIVKWLIGFLLLWQVPRCRKSPWKGKREERISVIIPARNEEANLPRLLDTLELQTVRPEEIIVVDDSSTDKTSLLARKRGALVIQAGDLPDDWTGKTWACWKGARAATGSHLLFLDADTQLEPDGLEKIIGEYRVQKRGLLSVYPYHAMEKLFERLSAYFNLVTMMSMGIATVLGSRLKPMGAFGACILCSSQDYFLCGGHREVRREIMEDVALGMLFSRKGLPMRCLAGRGTVRFRMYPEGIGQMIEGWSKNFASGAKASHIGVVLLVFAWIYGNFEALACVLTASLQENALSLVGASLLYSAYVLQIHWMLRRIGNFGFHTAVLFPVSLLFFLFLFLYSLMLTFVVRRVRWRGRSIVLHPKTDRG